MKLVVDAWGDARKGKKWWLASFVVALLLPRSALAEPTHDGAREASPPDAPADPPAPSAPEPRLPLGAAGDLAAAAAPRPSAEPLAAPPKREDEAAVDAYYQPLAPQGITTINIHPVSHTLDGDNPIRRALADIGVGYYALSISTAQQNVLNAARTSASGAQQYFGQILSAYSLNQLMLAFDLGKIGLKGGQIQAGLVYATATWEPAGPRQFSLGFLQYYQPLFGKAVEFKIGYQANNQEFVGTYVGGNLNSAIFGTSSTLPAEVGMSNALATKPGANVTLHHENLYAKFGASVSVNTGGYVAEKRDNVTGFKWKTDDANGMIIAELGYRRLPTATAPRTWVRAGYMRNWSDYNDYQFGGRSGQNYLFYFLADHQVIRFNNGPNSGLNVGGTAYLGLDRYSAIAQTYEARFYATGPFHSRPKDMASFIATDNAFSQYVVRAARNAGGHAKDASWVLTWAYSAAVAPGAYVGLGLSYADHPTVGGYTPDSPTAVGTRHALMPIANVSLFL